MASENAKAVAKDVIERVRNSKKINFQEIQQNRGYSKNSAKAMKAKSTQSYQNEIKPIVERLIEERDRAIRAMKGKISRAKYRDLTDAADKLTKNIQLLSGGSTEKVVLINLSKEIADKNVPNPSTSNNSERQT